MPTIPNRPWRTLLNPTSITLLYLVAGGFWIMFSDNWAVGLASDPTSLSKIQTYKGWFYILVTGGVLYFLISKHQKYVSESSQALRESQQQFEHIFFFNPYPMIIVDPVSERIVTMNKSFNPYLPASKNLDDIVLSDFFPAATIKAIRNKMEQTTDKTYIGVYQTRDTFVDTALIEVSGFVVKIREGPRWLLIMHDVTEETRSRERIVELTQSLERKVQERTVELRKINAELEAFSYSVSHDLRAPLRAIDGFSLAVVEEYGPTLDQNALHYLNRVRTASQKMAELIDDMTRLSRIARTNVSLEPLDLTTIINQIVSELRTVYLTGNHVVSVAPGLHAHSDRGLMSILLSNLIGNAFKYAAKESSPTIHIGITDESGMPEFFVQDNGIGFDEQYADKIFKSFQRLHEAVDYPGNGIGLATVQRVIAKLGGSIRAKSKPGQGSTFYFRVPDAPEGVA